MHQLSHSSGLQVALHGSPCPKEAKAEAWGATTSRALACQRCRVLPHRCPCRPCYCSRLGTACSSTVGGRMEDTQSDRLVGSRPML